MPIASSLRALAAFTGALTLNLAHAAPLYQLTDLGTLGGSGARATGIAAKGMVAGYAEPGGSLPVATAWKAQGDSVKALKPLIPGGLTRAFAVNDRGWAVGQAAAADGWMHATLWKGGRAQDLGVPLTMWASVARGINKLGWVVGLAQHGTSETRAFLSRDGVMQMIGPLDSVAYDINATGQIAGTQTPIPGTGLQHCWTAQLAAPVQMLPKLPGGASCAVSAVNDAGLIVGSSTTLGNSLRHAVLYQAGVAVDLGSLGGPSAHATDINNRGTIIGYASLSDGSMRGVLFSAQRAPVDLNTMLDPVSGAGYVVVQADAVNDAGQIAATADLAGERHAVVLTPLP